MVRDLGDSVRFLRDERNRAGMPDDTVVAAIMHLDWFPGS